MMPLAGCRVLDLGIITAGAATSALLADLGAEVIKIESPSYRDPFRNWLAEPAPTPGNDLPPYFQMTNRNKLSLGLDLKADAGRETFLRLVARSDVVVENFSRGVLARLAIDFPVLQRAQPGIILASISSQGETGPDARYISFGSTLEAAGGMAWLTGYAGGPPVVTSVELNYPDQVVALFAAGMIASAWGGRARDGDAMHLDLSQRELTSFLSGEAFATAERTRAGNMQAPYAVQDCLRCADGSWIAVSLYAQDLVAAAGLAGVAATTTADVAAGLAVWAQVRAAPDCLTALRGAGLAAAPVHDAAAVLGEMGGTWQDAMRRMPGGGLVKGAPFRFDGVPVPIRFAARTLGADTKDVLRRIGGLSEREIAALIAAGVAHTAEATP
jgi:crotonobetainyl-CoA:carnitine CoA-transferase CaiB-like acyl-CoA transferase